ncbi:hypothetical protein [Alcaligenes aquatilis]|uniref:Uncharacterized protein n=1 Tax=Alcaligenes aquatilis TaxID=323284 RepID=A0A3G2HT26_9BURK|nr:hypothetical protein [Alcaligenes aquatilis]AYN20051.1 hypothetical protein D3M96_05585 [Alcaligenes aquatilis]
MALAFEQTQQTVNRVHEVGDGVPVRLFGYWHILPAVAAHRAVQGQTQCTEGVFECQEQRSRALAHARIVWRHLSNQSRDDGARYQGCDQDKRGDNQRMEHRIDFMRDVAFRACGFSVPAGRCCVMRIHIR